MGWIFGRVNKVECYPEPIHTYGNDVDRIIRMPMYNRFNIGDYCKVVSNGQLYSTYTDMAFALGVKDRWVDRSCDIANEEIVEVINFAAPVHCRDIVYAVMVIHSPPLKYDDYSPAGFEVDIKRRKKGQIFLVGEKGLKLHHKEFFSERDFKL
jgi:hypothetical protein